MDFELHKDEELLHTAAPRQKFLKHIRAFTVKHYIISTAIDLTNSVSEQRIESAIVGAWLGQRLESTSEL